MICGMRSIGWQMNYPKSNQSHLITEVPDPSLMATVPHESTVKKRKGN
jgi:hypothetical protein